LVRTLFPRAAMTAWERQFPNIRSSLTLNRIQ
jgi:hypothetical protein